MRSIALTLAVLSGLFLGTGTAAARTGDLANWITDWRDRAHSVGTYAIPEEIRKNYRHAFPAGLFETVTYRVAGDPRVWSEASYFVYGSGRAVVVDNVVLFRSEHEVKSLGLWHQVLTQAKAFQQKGVFKVAAEHHAAIVSAPAYRGGIIQKPTRREYNDYALQRRAIGHDKQVYVPHKKGVLFVPKRKAVAKHHHGHTPYVVKKAHTPYGKKVVKKPYHAGKKTVFGPGKFYGKKIVFK